MSHVKDTSCSRCYVDCLGGVYGNGLVGVFIGVVRKDLNEMNEKKLETEPSLNALMWITHWAPPRLQKSELPCSEEKTESRK